MTTKEHLSNHDKEVAEIWALLGKMAKGMLDFQAGMRELQASQKRTDASIRELQAGQREFQAGMKALRASQKQTEASLKAFIDSMRRGGNGNGKRKMDLH
jgi:hypothetical protein